jgi:hypothetical protein
MILLNQKVNYLDLQLVLNIYNETFLEEIIDFI